MNNPCFAVGQVCNLPGQDAILSYDYLCNTIIHRAGVTKKLTLPLQHLKTLNTLN
jgi:hypothetical protein